MVSLVSGLAMALLDCLLLYEVADLILECDSVMMMQMTQYFDFEKMMAD
jgi:hypothetical protein